MSNIIKSLLNSAVLTCEKIFDGNTCIPLTQIKPNLKGWHLDTAVIFEKHSMVIDWVSQTLTEKYQISSTIKISAQLVSTAVIWHNINTSQNSNKLASNLHDVQEITK